ncbi:hypothetical protein BDF22DRAFT_739242 [Syncephalis plumigaleata]|nr:hypothetical protein BDF22DRAFT_739242 [Syncephalis plumigaleata]
MKFFAIIAIAVAVVALTSLVAVEASPVLDRRAPMGSDSVPCGVIIPWINKYIYKINQAFIE